MPPVKTILAISLGFRECMPPACHGSHVSFSRESTIVLDDMRVKTAPAQEWGFRMSSHRHLGKWDGGVVKLYV